MQHHQDHHGKRKRGDASNTSSRSLAPHHNGQAENVTSQGQSTAASGTSLPYFFHNQQQQQPLQISAESTTTGQDQIQNILNFLSSTNQFNSQQVNNTNTSPPVMTQLKRNDPDPTQALNYEVAALLASLHNQNTAASMPTNDSSQQLFHNNATSQATQEPALPQDNNELLQKAALALLQSMNPSSSQQQVYPNVQSFSSSQGPFHMMSQSHTTQTSSSSRSNLQSFGTMQSAGGYPNTAFPTAVQATNTSNLDVFRLLLLSTTQQPQQVMPPPQQGNNNALLNNLLLQSLGLPQPVVPPPPPQVDPNLLTMLLSQIAMNTNNANSNMPTHAPAPTAAADNVTSRYKNDDLDDSSEDTCELAGVAPIPIATPMDEQHVSKYQCLVRQQIQFFEATEADVASTAQGRNKPIVLGQVGIQCSHCVKVPPKLRARGAVYFPSKWSGIYQAAQNMASAHFSLCSDTPEHVKDQLAKLKEGKSTAGGGKKFWGESAAEMGVFEDRHGLRFKKSQHQPWSAASPKRRGYCGNTTVQEQV